VPATVGTGSPPRVYPLQATRRNVGQKAPTVREAAGLEGVCDDWSFELKFGRPNGRVNARWRDSQ
jgi:hypothetical protein